MTIKEILTAARDLILSPAHWCQGSFYQTGSSMTCTLGHAGATVYRDLSGREVTPTCFCLVGAVRHVTRHCPNLCEPALKHLREFVHTHPNYSVVYDLTIANDRSSHVQVIELFTRAIDAA